MEVHRISYVGRGSMDKRKIIIGSIGLIACTIVAIVLLTINQKPPEKTPEAKQSQGTPKVISLETRSKNDILNAIIRSLPEYTDASQRPTIDVVSFSLSAQHWYVAKIKLIADSSNNYAMVLVHDPSSNVDDMKVVLGPGTSFDKSYTPDNLDIPDKVFEDLNS